MSMTFNNKYLQGTYKIIDLSFYAAYKEYGDNVICMFVYLGFIWYVFNHLSGIIRGSTFGNGHFAQVHDHVVEQYRSPGGGSE